MFIRIPVYYCIRLEGEENDLEMILDLNASGVDAVEDRYINAQHIIQVYDLTDDSDLEGSVLELTMEEVQTPLSKEEVMSKIREAQRNYILS